MQVNDRIEEALARGNTYKLLSIAFIRELTPESIEVFRGSDMAEILRELGEGFGREFYNRDEQELLKELAKNEAGAYRENKADGWVALQKEFLQDHLSRWAADFAGDVAKYTRQPFYREMARLLYEFIRSEAEELMVYQENM